jgi:hypothetical protein
LAVVAVGEIGGFTSEEFVEFFDSVLLEIGIIACRLGDFGGMKTAGHAKGRGDGKAGE